MPLPVATMASHSMLSSYVLLIALIVLCASHVQANKSQSNDAVKVPAIPRPQDPNGFKTILTLDGAGLRLYFSTQLLKGLEKGIKKYYLSNKSALPKGIKPADIQEEDDFDILLADYFDVICGVSASSWVAVYLASKGGNGKANEYLKSPDIAAKYGRVEAGTARGLDVFFEEFSQKIYPVNLPSIVKGIRFRPSGFSFPFSVPGLNAPLCSPDGLIEALDKFVGDVKLSEFSTSCLINAYSLEKNSPAVFAVDFITQPPHTVIVYTPTTNIGDKRKDPSRTSFGDAVIEFKEYSGKDVALASSALPVFHPAHTAKPVSGGDAEDTFADGALVESNPTNYAIAFVTSLDVHIPVEQVAIVSIGTGSIAGRYMSAARRGAYGWLFSGDFLEIALGGSAEARQSQIDYQLYDSFKVKQGQYLRLNHFISSDDADTAAAFGTFFRSDLLPIYRSVGEQTAKDYEPEIFKFIKNFVFNDSLPEPAPKPTT